MATWATGTSSIRFWSFPLPISSVDFDRRVIEVALRELVEVVASAAGVEQVAGDHRVERDAGELDAGVARARSCRT